MEFKFNGNIFKEGKLNGNFITFSKIQSSEIQDLIISNNINEKLNYYYANSFSKINGYNSLFSLDSNETFNNFNELNIIPKSADRIIGENDEGVKKEDIILQDNFISNLEEPLYKVGVISDIHIDAYGDDYGDSQNDFINALNFYNANNVDFIIINGDLVSEGYEVDYQKYVEIVNNYSNGIPIKTIRGNHECYYDGGYDANNTRYETYIGQPNYYEFIKNNDIYLFLSCMKEDGNNLTSEQTTWLSQKLEQYKNNRVFLFTHYPYGEVGSIGNIIDKTQMSNPQFLNLIKQYKNIVYFSGHSHTNFEAQTLNKFANIKKADDICNRVHISSLARPRVWDGSELVNSPEGSQGYLMEVYDNGILLRGYDFVKQKYVAIAQYFLNILSIF